MIRMIGRSGTRERQEFAARFEALAQQLANLEPVADRPSLIVGVTSCHSGEGVTTVAVNLALSATHVFFRPILLVDARHDKPVLAREFAVPPEPGLSDVLRGETPLTEAIRPTEVRHLSLLPAGAGRAALAGPATADLFGQVRQDFSLVVIDLPPISDQQGVIPFPTLLDGFLLVMEPARTRLADLQRTKDRFQQARGKLLGVVLNKER